LALAVRHKVCCHLIKFFEGQRYCGRKSLDIFAGELRVYSIVPAMVGQIQVEPSQFFFAGGIKRFASCPHND
jgi:hypothetical protein